MGHDHKVESNRRVLFKKAVSDAIALAQQTPPGFRSDARAVIGDANCTFQEMNETQTTVQDGSDEQNIAVDDAQTRHTAPTNVPYGARHEPEAAATVVA